jgi:hypothetical protein
MEPPQKKKRGKKKGASKKLSAADDLPAVAISSSEERHFSCDFGRWLSDPRTYIVILVSYLIAQKFILPLNFGSVTSGFRFTHVDPKNALITHTTVPPSASPSALLIYTTCQNAQPFSIWRATIPSVGIECDNRTRFNDCNEAVPYLNFVIDHYDERLADKYIFAHGHDTSWHYQGDFFDALESLLTSTYFRKMKYGGVFRGNYFKGAWGVNEEKWARPLHKFVFAGTSMPPEPIEVRNQRPCCATFWLNAELIHSRKRHEYIIMRDRLREWSRQNNEVKPNPAWFCGRTMEYSWHIIFTKSAFVDACHLCQGES